MAAMRNFVITCDKFYDRMTVHRNRFHVNKTNRRTEIQFLLVLRLYMFRAAVLPIIRSS